MVGDIVTEADGFVIDEDDVLLEIKESLLLLEEGQRWKSVDEAIRMTDQTITKNEQAPEPISSAGTDSLGENNICINGITSRQSGRFTSVCPSVRPSVCRKLFCP